MSLFTDDMILRLENHEIHTYTYTHNSMKANTWIQQSGRTQKSVVFLHTNSEQAEMEITRTIPFTTAFKRIKYTGIN